MRRLWLWAGLAAVAAVPAPARADPYEIEVPGKGSLGLVGATVYVVNPPARAAMRDWQVGQRPGEPVRIRAAGGLLGGSYLGVDAKEGTVGLAGLGGLGGFGGRALPPGWLRTRLPSSDACLLQWTAGR